VDQIQLVRVKSDDVTIFTPETMAKILHAAPPALVPILAIVAFSGIRMAELNQLDWKTVDLDRRIIEIRAGQAKTASRRIIPIPGNLDAWLRPLTRKGKVVHAKELQISLVRQHDVAKLLLNSTLMSLTDKERIERERQRRETANERMREKVAAARRRGICRCGGKLDKKPGTTRNYSTCPACREKAVASATRYYR
jgi:integrase